MARSTTTRARSTRPPARPPAQPAHSSLPLCTRTGERTVKAFTQFATEGFKTVEGTEVPKPVSFAYAARRCAWSPTLPFSSVRSDTVVGDIKAGFEEAWGMVNSKPLGSFIIAQAGLLAGASVRAHESCFADGCGAGFVLALLLFFLFGPGPAAAPAWVPPPPAGPPPSAPPSAQKKKD